LCLKPGTLARKQFEILGTAAVGTLKSIATSAGESPVLSSSNNP
jgi:hypothetical protein